MSLVDELGRVPLFQQLSAYHLQLIAAQGEERIVPAGTVLTRQADLGNTFFLIRRGEAIVHRVDENGLRRPVDMIRHGDYFGTTSLFLGEPRDATVTAKTEMRLWMLTRPGFQRLLAEHDEVRRKLTIRPDVRERLRAPRFAWLGPGEVVIYHTRRHWSVLARSVAPLTLISLLCFSALLWLKTWLGDVRNLFIPFGLLFSFYALSFLWYWIDWRNDYFAASTQRVVHRERVAFLYESRSDAPLARIQDFQILRGFMGQMLGYGDLIIETAAEVGAIGFDQIPHPEEARDAIWEQMARVQATRHAEQRQAVRDTLARHLGLEAAATATETRNLEDIVSASYASGLTSTQVRPGSVTRLLTWIAEQGLIPRTRIQTEESTTWRKHWIFLVKETVLPLFMCFVVSVAMLLGFLGIPGSLVMRLQPYYPLVLIPVVVFLLGLLWWNINDWGNDLYIVTEDRIIDIEKRPLFMSEERREASLGMIQNVNLEIPNLIASAFNYGSVIIQTAGAGSFTFDNVPNPHDVQNEIFRHIEAFRAAQRQKETQRRQAELAEWFSVYDDLRGVKREGTVSKDDGVLADTE
ncbi:MAG: cyclic nucleotide-binding domain-containing protein [Chloroflexota bacterium]|nr:cyclic nucleotide-binding domain-containing protein [Chloroflexota bacterium]